MRVSRLSSGAGSNDSGVTIHADPEVGEIMRQAAKILNIKGHMCGMLRGQGKFLYSPTDLGTPSLHLSSSYFQDIYVS
jgi:hypothetical protein